MPLPSSLAAPGSSRRTFLSTQRIPLIRFFFTNPYFLLIHQSPTKTYTPCLHLPHPRCLTTGNSSTRPILGSSVSDRILLDRTLSQYRPSKTSIRFHSDSASEPSAISSHVSRSPFRKWLEHPPQKVISRRRFKRERKSRPELVVESIRFNVQNGGEPRISYENLRNSEGILGQLSRDEGELHGLVGEDWAGNDLEETGKRIQPLPAPLDIDWTRESVSLYSVLGRYLKAAAPDSPQHQFGLQELDLLASHGFTEHDVKLWAASVTEHNPRIATATLHESQSLPPYFLLLILLRRKHISAVALGSLMRLLAGKLQMDPIEWSPLKAFLVRLIRHARRVWPETLPWIASTFRTEATRIQGEMDSKENTRDKFTTELTQFCNTLISLISVPLSIHPIALSKYQEVAQFEILAFMAQTVPTVTVTRSGFRGVVRVQLARPKTAEEREWAMLKRPAWPPWKHDRTAMDEDKGFEFGASRAMQIMFRMFEAGYTTDAWTDLAQIFAGWDTDLSPTIQTRTLLPHTSKSLNAAHTLKSSLWGARIRTTRTLREAWAAFLAFEASESPANPEVYHAMFEKLYAADHPESSEDSLSSQHLLPGDMKEVLPDPHSPLGLIHIAEPIPSFEQLYRRMCKHGVIPRGRFLAFLIQSPLQFETIQELLDSSTAAFEGGLETLVNGSVLYKRSSKFHDLPGYLIHAFIRFLCRFGVRRDVPSLAPISPSMAEHKVRFSTDREYLLDYAHALLIRRRPLYRPAWTAYMHHLIYDRWKLPIKLAGSTRERREIRILSQYHTMSDLLTKMHSTGVEVDEEQVRFFGIVLRAAGDIASQGAYNPKLVHDITQKGSRQLRKLFHNLIAGGLALETHAPHVLPIEPTPPLVPRAALLHVYVRALGAVRDYEGLYSFSTWAVSHAAQISAAMEAHVSPSNSLERLWRRTLVALRCALEGRLSGGQHNAPASTELIVLTKAQIDSIEDWGGWPSDEEVEEYVQVHQGEWKRWGYGQ
ncbi:hypothetical protein BU24DRAFT_377002 [Aaosphaeria arxii CBS 175.79]|uniref:Uncharacterized protein n=1 Tax=Aaosphaeria arxii CBS 175.79 TaxID=1450172 RepID=A0A6A5XFQ8_9PLEO|nr:uncharacterized protein BU24DRAFT_377002 [Aaosphaeria arxii CBS 175.79]KAF2011661.1 hypothetical protein BU24DRAFT_377002 [Aaosphaeria arxii CBS 175.79]